LRNLKELIGFVPQDDIVHPYLTVRENILHSARVRLGGVLTDREVEKRVQQLIQALGLSNVKDNLVGDPLRRGISGGERKRVNIALELIVAPRLLILDEPTSVLDAGAALSTIMLLKSLCRHGITVICVIHQPRVEIFEALDSLLLLRDGTQAYFGKASEAQKHFTDMG
jgi:ABC-type multidrug transport system ATPase subunit